MTIVLTDYAHELLQRELARHPGQTPEQVIERALESLDSAEPSTKAGSTTERTREAAARLRELRKGISLGGVGIRSLLHEAHRY